MTETPWEELKRLSEYEPIDTEKFLKDVEAGKAWAEARALRIVELAYIVTHADD